MATGDFSGRRLWVPALPPGDPGDFTRIASTASTQFSAELGLIDRRMVELIGMTREVPGWNICLYIQRRSGRGSSLRWRSSAGGIVPDAKLLPSLHGYPKALQEWYRSVHANVLWLNRSERICRRLTFEYSELANSISGMLTGREAGLPA